VNSKLSAALVAASLAIGGGLGAIAAKPSTPTVTFQNGDVVVTSDCRCILKGQPDVMRKCYEAADQSGDALPVCPR
jgi:hypothetical protein